MFDQNLAQFSIPRSADSVNADAIGIQEFGPRSFCIALADGVGKSQFGPEASALATKIATSFPLSADLTEIFERIRQALVDGAKKTQDSAWSTTLTLCRVEDGMAYVGHVGDSRIYHLRGKGIMTRTRDQTEVQVLIDEGVLSKERAKKYPRRNVLLSALSSESTYDLYVSSFEVIPGDRILLLSDGIYRQISRKEIAAISAKNGTVKTFIAELEELLLSRGVVDDSTALCVEIE